MAIDRLRLSSFLDNKGYRERFVKAMEQLKKDGIYQIFVDWHADLRVGAVAHNNVTFLHWHRAFLRLFEIEMQKVDAALQKAANPKFDSKNVISLPFWDYPRLNAKYADNATGRMWKNNFLGPSGTPKPIPNSPLYLLPVLTGPFAGVAKWPLKVRDPLDTSKTLIRHKAPKAPAPGFLMRNLGHVNAPPLPRRKEIEEVVKLTTFDDGDFTNPTTAQPPAPNVTPSSSDSFRAALEGWVEAPGISSTKSRLHNGVHRWVSGTMGYFGTSPNDPVFWLHHAMIDRIWAQWQVLHPTKTAQFPSDASIARARRNNPNAIRADQAMLPWDGANMKWKGLGAATLTTGIIRPKDVHNWTRMGAGLGGYRIHCVGSKAIKF